MSFKPYDINPDNYEEFFLLYVDGELNAAAKLAVENFIGQHPHLANELDMLMSCKLPVDGPQFSGKEELFSPAMKATTVDENLLLYIDGELAGAEKAGVEEKLKADKDFALQHALLLQTKLDAAEKMPHPYKKELYRHTERVRVFTFQMRYAAAVLLLLFGSWFFFLRDNNAAVEATYNTASNDIKNNRPAVTQETPAQQAAREAAPLKNEPNVAVAETRRRDEEKPLAAAKQDLPVKEKSPATTTSANDVASVRKDAEAIRFDTHRFTSTEKFDATIVLNKTITRSSVTSGLDERTTIEDGDEETAGSDADFKETKKTPAKGFFRKVSRFIERRTGIGTVNDDNELLIGAVALKLK